jgi:hypothetical protein
MLLLQIAVSAPVIGPQKATLSANLLAILYAVEISE